MLDSGDVFVRVLNYSLISKNAIYTDFLIPATAINDYYVDSRIFIQDSPKLQALTITIQSKTSLTLTSQISVFTLRLTPLVTYNPIGTRESAEMQLLAYIPDSGSQVTLGSARVEFDIKGGGTSGSDDTSTKWYDEW